MQKFPLVLVHLVFWWFKQENWRSSKARWCLHHDPTLNCHSTFVVLTQTVEVRWPDRIWKINLSHQEQGAFRLHRGLPPTPLLTNLMNFPFPSTANVNLYPNAPLLQHLRRTQGHFTNERCDISTSTSAPFKLTGCRCDLSFCLVDKVNWIKCCCGVFFHFWRHQWW